MKIPEHINDIYPTSPKCPFGGDLSARASYLELCIKHILSCCHHSNDPKKRAQETALEALGYAPPLETGFAIDEIGGQTYADVPDE